MFVVGTGRPKKVRPHCGFQPAVADGSHQQLGKHLPEDPVWRSKSRTYERSTSGWVRLPWAKVVQGLGPEKKNTRGQSLKNGISKKCLGWEGMWKFNEFGILIGTGIVILKLVEHEQIRILWIWMILMFGKFIRLCMSMCTQNKLGQMAPENHLSIVPPGWFFFLGRLWLLVLETPCHETKKTSKETVTTVTVTVNNSWLNPGMKP